MAEPLTDFEKALQEYGPSGATYKPQQAPVQSLESALSEYGPGAATTPEPPTAGQYVKQAVGSAVRGAAGVAASLPEEIGIQSAALSRLTGGDIGFGEGDPGKPEDRAAYQFGQAIRKFAERITAEENPALRESFWATKVPGGVGSAAGFMVGGAAGKLIKVPAWLGISGLGSAASSVDFYNDAKSKGADEKTAYLSSLVGNIVGTSEAIPLSRMLNRLDKVSGGSFTKTLVNAGKESFEEALQEATQQLAQNYTARELYDKDRELFKDLEENAAVGGVTGALFSLITQSVGRRIGRQPQGVSTESNPLKTPQPAGQAAQPAPAAPPPIPKAMERFVTKNDGDLVSDAERSQLASLAKEELAGSVAPERAQAREAVLNLEPAYRNAYTIIKEGIATQQKIEEAAAKTDTNPTEAQKEAGNYEKGKVDVDGMTISIENPSGSTRSGKDRDGNEWSVKMPAHYGYILNTVGKDKDHLDIYLGPQTESPNVVVVNQVNPKDGSFDEHKVLYGFPSTEQAIATYDAAFSDASGPSRRGSVSVLSKEEFQTWLKEGDKKKPVETKGGEINAKEQVQETGGLPAEQGITPVVQPEVQAQVGTPQRGSEGQAPVVTPETDFRSRPQQALTEFPPPEPSAILADVDDSIFLGKTLKGKSREGFFFDVDEQPYSETLGQRLTVNARPMGSEENNKKYTRQRTFFLDKETGQVVGLGIVDQGSGKFDVGPAPGQSRGSKLKDFMASGRYVPIGSITLKTPFARAAAASAQVFPNRAAYDQFAQQARALYQEKAANAQAAATKTVAVESVSSQGVPSVTEVQTETPADELQQKEGFTQDEAGYIFDAIKGIKIKEKGGIITPESRKKFITAIRSEPDAFFAMQKLLDALEPILENDPNLALYTIEQYVHDAQTLNPKSKEGFAKSLYEAVDRISKEGAGKGANKASSAARADNRAAAGGGKVEAPVNLGEAVEKALAEKGVRLHTGRLDEKYRPEQHKVGSAYSSALSALAAAGYAIQVVEAESAGMAREFGQFDNAGRMVSLVVSNIGQPTIDNLYHLNAEVAHAVYANLSPDVQNLLQEGIRSATDEMLGIDRPFEIAPAVPEELRNEVANEERIVDLVARNLTKQNFIAAQANSLARQFWNLLKSLYLRAALSLSKAWSGTPSANLSTQYLQTRVEQFLAGNVHPLSFTDFLGGGARSPWEIGERFDPSNGYTALSFRWSPAGFVEVQETDPDSVSAVLQRYSNPTIRYHSGTLGRDADTGVISPDIGPEATLADVAANNAVSDALTLIHGAWTGAGHNTANIDQKAFNGFVLQGTGVGDPETNIQTINDQLQKTGKTQVDPATRAANLNEGGKKESAHIAYRILNKLRSRWAAKYESASYELSGEPGSAKRRHARNALRVQTLTTRYTDTEFLFSEVKLSLDGWLKYLRMDLNLLKNKSHRNGVLAEAIGKIEGKFDQELGKQYEGVINRLVRRFAENADSQTKFVSLLTKIAETNVDWGNTDLATIKDLISQNVDPEFDIFRDGSADSRALLAIAAAFAKRDGLLMHSMALRRAAKTDDMAQERHAVNEIIKTAIYGGRNGLENARRDATKLTKLGARAALLLNELERIQVQQRILADEIERQRQFMAFHESTRTALAEQIAVHERQLGISQEAFEPMTGALMLRVENENEAPDLILNRKRDVYSPLRNGAADTDLREQMALKQRWLNAHGPGNPFYKGDVYNRIAIELAKLGENEMQAQLDKNQRSLITAVFGPMSTKLDNTGHPAAKGLARMLRSWAGLHYLWREFGGDIANSWSPKAFKAARELGFNRAQMERFFEIYHDASWDFVARRLDLQLAAPDNAAAFEAKIQAMLSHAKQPDGSPLTAKQADLLEAFWRDSADASEKMGQAAQNDAMLRVRDEDAGVYRNFRGTKGELRRSMNGTLRRVYDLMVGKAGNGNQGPWFNQPLEKLPDGSKRDLAQEYATNPDALRASVAPLFAGDIWTDFVTPYANRPGRSAFHAAPDPTGFRRLASVDETRTALQNSGGDIVKFAEVLHQITGGQPDSLPAFVSETIGTVGAYFNWIHQLHQQEGNMRGRTLTPVQHLMMDARLSNEMPPEHMRYERFDLHSVRQRMSQLALHSAFGRNLEAADDLWAQARNHFANLESVFKRKVIDLLPPSPTLKDGERLARAAGFDLDELQRAATQSKMLEHEYKSFVNFVNASGGVALEFKAWSELLSTMVAYVVQGPKTALIDTSSLFKPIQIFGATGVGIKYTARNIKSTAGVVTRGLLESIGIQLKGEADHMERLHRFNQLPTADRYGLASRTATAALGYPSSEADSVMEKVTRGISVQSRTLREVLGTPFPSLTKPEDRTELRPKPALFTYGSQAMHLGSIIGTWRTFETLVTDAGLWLDGGNGSIHRNDPNFRFNPSHAGDLGYNEREFGQLLAMLHEQGLTLESLAKNWIGRGRSGPVMDDTAYRRIMTIAPSQLMQEASIISRSSSLITNPLLHLATPLIGWSWTQTGSLVGPTRKPITGERENIPQVVKNLTLSFLPLIGVGLAYALMADWYDEWILKKKSNRLTLSNDNLALATIDRLNVSGTLGIAGDLVNGFVNVSTARDVSLDSRVFAVNSMLGVYRAATAWWNQGTASYQTVGRPLAMALGGSGALQYLQAFNGLLGLDNAESRATRRINVNNWLRVGGRGTGMDVRVGRGMEFIPNRTTPWIREMVLSTYANDPETFGEAYRQAVMAARADKRDDPVRYVRDAFAYQHPLKSVFKQWPSEQEYRKLYLSLPDAGKRDVSEAISLINRYGQRLEIEPFLGSKPKSKLGLNRSDILKQEAISLSGRSLLGF